ncbi:MAG: hypothetical protein JNK35_02465 [Phycisphaerae bacterium]|nr:hypothetical protein [Phycisphaerae bacterium]
MHHEVTIHHCVGEPRAGRGTRGPRGTRMASCLPAGEGRVVAFAADWESVDRLRAWAASVGLEGRIAVHHRDGRLVFAGGIAGAATDHTRPPHTTQGVHA